MGGDGGYGCGGLGCAYRRVLSARGSLGGVFLPGFTSTHPPPPLGPPPVGPATFSGHHPAAILHCIFLMHFLVKMSYCIPLREILTCSLCRAPPKGHLRRPPPSGDPLSQWFLPLWVYSYFIPWAPPHPVWAPPTNNLQWPPPRASTSGHPDGNLHRKFS